MCLSAMSEEIARLRTENEALRARTALYEEAFRQSPLAACHHDLDLRYTWIYHPHMGFAPADVIGRTDYEILEFDLADRMSRIKRRVLETGIGEKHVIPTHEPPRADTEYFELVTEPRRNAEGKIVGLLCTGIDVTELTRVAEQLRAITAELASLSRTDPLTNIANRRHFDAVLYSEVERANRNETTLSLVLMDLDWFKQYNDTLGHQQGDQLLIRFAELLSSHTRRPGDLVARYGGEEFVLILPDTDTEGAQMVAGQIRRELKRLALPHPTAQACVVTVSVGVAVKASARTTTVDELIYAADKEMYAAKAGGRDCVRAVSLEE
jgi:diguanylate cyclase (GGDEF)-like protein